MTLLAQVTFSTKLITHEPNGDLEQDFHTVTQGITKRLEQEIKEHPDHWFWMHQRWKGSPKFQTQDQQVLATGQEI